MNLGNVQKMHIAQNIIIRNKFGMPTRTVPDLFLKFYKDAVDFLTACDMLI